MPTKVVVLSGPVASGKSTLTQSLADRFGFRSLKTRELIQTLRPEVPFERASLQEAGDSLDRETGGAWVSKAIEGVLAHEDKNVSIVVDSIRIKEQIDGIRAAY